MVSLSALAAGCRPAPQPDRAERGAGGGSSALREESPADVARTLHDLFQLRDIDAIAPHLVSDHREATLTILRAISDVLAANMELREAVGDFYHLPATDTWDLAFIENNLGPFSARVRLINQKYRGDEAFVTLQEGENVPLFHARFVLADGRWLFEPEPPPPGMALELHGLAESLRDVAGMVRGGAEYEAYLATFFTRAIPRIRRVLNTPPRGAVAAGSADEP